MTEPRIQPLMAGGKCLGHIIRSARGYRAFDAKNVQIGTYRTAEEATAAVAGLGPKSGPKLADTADTGRLSDGR
jgi:hypothetical protein